MDGEKAGAIGAATKKEKVGADGLTKKQRRALTLQKRDGPEVSNHVAPNQKLVLKEEIKSVKATEIQGDKTEEKPVAQLSEKELRRLEWEKKQAEQKLTQKDDKGLSKAELRSKRREEQEAQRLKKTTANIPPKAEIIEKVAKVANKPVKKVVKKSWECGKTYSAAEKLKRLEYESSIVNYKDVHPVFVRLGIQYATKRILGSNARCLSMLTAIKYLVNDLEIPPDQEFGRFLETSLHSCINYLQYCRPFAVSMTNAIRHFKGKIPETASMEEEDAKKFLINWLQTYIHDDIGKASEAISLKVSEKIANGDVILTYGCSSLIKKILLDAHKEGTKFEVIVVDGRPFLEGRQMLQRLVEEGLNCSYVQVGALSHVIRLANKVLLGAHALLTNGYVTSRIGTAEMAMIARDFNKPVLACCETYKFSERVQTDSFIYNELGDTKVLRSVDTLDESSRFPSNKGGNITVLNMLYDVAPPELFTAVVTELAILPCTSVPVVLRIKPMEYVLMQYK